METKTRYKVSLGAIWDFGVNPNGKEIATVKFGVESTNLVRQANSAPELLEALEFMLKSIDFTPGMAQAWDKARAAIAKARGQA